MGQEREEERPRACLELQQEYDEETEDEEEEENTVFAANLANLVGMGFIREEAGLPCAPPSTTLAWPSTISCPGFPHLHFPPRKKTRWLSSGESLSSSGSGRWSRQIPTPCRLFCSVLGNSTQP